MILVTGASGKLGKATLEYLLQHLPANTLAGLARTTETVADLAAKGISIRKGDYDNYPSLLKAMHGIEKVLLVSTTAFNDRFAQHSNVINAAKEAGVKHLVYTSLQREDDMLLKVPGKFESDIRTENLLRESGLTYTILKNALYADVLPFYIGFNALQTGVVVPLAQGEGRLSLYVKHLSRFLTPLIFIEFDKGYALNF